MFMLDPNKDKPTIDDLIMEVMQYMSTCHPNSEEYLRLLDQYDRLSKIKAQKKRRFNVSPDVMAGILGNIAVVLIIVGYEHAHVMTSKASAFLKTKPID